MGGVDGKGRDEGALQNSGEGSLGPGDNRSACTRNLQAARSLGDPDDSLYLIFRL